MDVSFRYRPIGLVYSEINQQLYLEAQRLRDSAALYWLTTALEHLVVFVFLNVDADCSSMFIASVCFFTASGIEPPTQDDWMHFQLIVYCIYKFT